MQMACPSASKSDPVHDPSIDCSIQENGCCNTKARAPTTLAQTSRIRTPSGDARVEGWASDLGRVPPLNESSERPWGRPAEPPEAPKEASEALEREAGPHGVHAVPISHGPFCRIAS